MADEATVSGTQRSRWLAVPFFPISGALTLAALVWVGTQLASDWGSPLLGWTLVVAAMGTLSFACWKAARTGTDLDGRKFWQRQAGAYGMFTTALVVNAVEGLAETPDPGHLAALVFVPGVLALGSTVLVLPAPRRSPAEWLTMALDAAAVIAAVSLYAWVLADRFELFGPRLLSSLTLVWLALTALLGAQLVVGAGLRYQCQFRHLTIVLLAGGALAAAATSGLMTTLTDHPNLDEAHISAPTACLFWIAAIAVHHHTVGRPVSTRRHSARRPFSLLPFVSAAAVGALVIVAGPTSAKERMVVHGALFFACLVLARQLTAAYDNARLMRKVDAGMLELRRHEERFRSMVQQAADIIVIVSPNGVIDYASPALRQLLGLAHDGEGTQMKDYVHPEDMPAVSMHIRQVAAVPGGVATFRARLRGVDGSWRWLEIISTNLLGDPSVRGIVGNARDITDMLRYQEQLARQATHDELTGLPNRSLLLTRLDRALNADPTLRVGVALIDLDDFRAINDQLGHAVGDALLIGVAERLTQHADDDDVVARMGGDEFAVLVTGASVDDLTIALDRIMSALESPIQAAGYDLLVQASIGLADGTGAGEDAVAGNTLVRRADVALYAAKERGRQRYTRYEPGMDRRSIQHTRIGAELRQAMDAGDQLYLLYQPIVGLPDGQIRSVEALVRWRRPGHGVVSPADFIPLAERTGLIVPLGLWILREACGQAARWGKDPRTASLSVSVNVSARQLRDPGFPGDLAAVISETSLNPARLTIEVTETAVFDSDVALEALRAIHDLGVRVALDDFGTGHSSLGLLRSCPVDVLKVDKSFVDGVTGTAEQAAIAISLIQITSTMRLAAVAEGVETAEQAHTLHELGYQFAQGFHFARPLPPAEVTALLTDAAAAQPAPV